jgi:CRP-like cAMP-binding protein
MTVKTPFPEKKVVRKNSANRRASLRPAATREVMLSPAEMGTSSERTAVFDPRLLLTKLATGRTSREYQAEEAVFSQGDAADAVFYIQSGKVKLTAVSTQRSRGCHPAGR